MFKKVSEFLSRYPRAVMCGALGLAAAVFLCLTLSKIGAWSVWFDESFSAQMVRQNFADIWHYTALDVNAPLYYYLLKIWSLVAGHSDVALRFLSVLFGLGTLVGGFFLARKLFCRRVGYFALLFLTLSPMLLRYATEMRCYTLLIFLLIMATYVFVLAQEKHQRKLWLLYGFLIALCMWTHYYAALPILAHWAWRAITAKKFFTREFVTSLMLAAVLFLPWLVIMIKQLTTVQINGFWIPPFGFDTVANFLGEATIYSTHDRIVDFAALGLVAALALLAILLIRARRTLIKKKQANLWLVLLVILLPPLVLAILSMPPLRPMFVNRYVIFSMVAFSFLIAVAVGVKLKTRAGRAMQIVFLILMLMLSGWGLRNVLYFGNYNFDTKTVSMAKNLMMKIADFSSAKTIVIAESPWVFYDANVYASDKNPVYFLDSSTSYEYGSLAMLQDDKTHKIVDLKKFVSSGQKVWYISASENGALSPPAKNWHLVRTISVNNPIDGEVHSSAAEYVVSW
jgi:4-amino-4-deoxy-L-arabinose transferase-like glycosyltransferase